MADVVGRRRMVAVGVVAFAVPPNAARSTGPSSGSLPCAAGRRCRSDGSADRPRPGMRTDRLGSRCCPGVAIPVAQRELISYMHRRPGRPKESAVRGSTAAASTGCTRLIAGNCAEASRYRQCQPPPARTTSSGTSLRSVVGAGRWLPTQSAPPPAVHPGVLPRNGSSVTSTVCLGVTPEWQPTDVWRLPTNGDGRGPTIRNSPFPFFGTRSLPDRVPGGCGCPLTAGGDGAARMDGVRWISGDGMTRRGIAGTA